LIDFCKLILYLLTRTGCKIVGFGWRPDIAAQGGVKSQVVNILHAVRTLLRSTWTTVVCKYALMISHTFYYQFFSTVDHGQCCNNFAGPHFWLKKTKQRHCLVAMYIGLKIIINNYKRKNSIGEVMCHSCIY